MGIRTPSSDEKQRITGCFRANAYAPAEPHIGHTKVQDLSCLRVRSLNFNYLVQVHQLQQHH